MTDIDKPSSALEALNRCNPETHSNIQALLKLLSTLPLTSCDAERTFSALKRVKTVGRSTIGEGRLEGLMNIHKRIHVDAAAAVKMTSRRKPQEERCLHPLKVKQREVGYRTCWLDPGPALLGRTGPCKQSARAQMYVHTYRDPAHSVLYCECIPTAVISLQKALTLLQTGQDS